jgi:hypothetical protein
MEDIIELYKKLFIGKKFIYIMENGSEINGYIEDIKLDENILFDEETKKRLDAYKDGESMMRMSDIKVSKIKGNYKGISYGIKIIYGPYNFNFNECYIK